MVLGAVLRQKSKMFMIAFTVALGVSLPTAMLNIMLGIGDRVNQELETYGANINVVPKDASLLGDLYGIGDEAGAERSYLDEPKLGNAKTIFRVFNIVDYTPYFGIMVQADGNTEQIGLVGTWAKYRVDLPTGESTDIGMQHLKSWWEMNGEWLDEADPDGVMVGSIYASQNNLSVGDRLGLKSNALTKTTVIRSIFSSRSDEDQHIYCVLPAIQAFADKRDMVSSIEVSALTTSDNELARKVAQNPLSLTVKEWEVWHCTAYVGSICYQIQEAIPDLVVKPIRQVAGPEDDILNKTTLPMVLITVLSLLGSVLDISGLMTAAVMGRRIEIGLEKATGASNGCIVGTILTKIILTGVIDGMAGYSVGLMLTQLVGFGVFDSAIPPAAMVIPIVALLIFFVIPPGSIPAIRYLLHLNLTGVLHGK